MSWTVSIDGGARGNPGPAAAGIQIQDASGDVVFSAGLFLGRKTNNEAEYAGLLMALDVLHAAGADHVTIHSDSELLVRQLQGQYRVKAANLQPLYERAKAAARRIGTCRFQHVRREQNTQADALVNEALDAARDVIAADPRGLIVALGRPAAASRAQPASPRPGAPAGSAGKPSAATRNRSASSSQGVNVTVIKGPKARGCPAAARAGQRFVFTDTIPAGLCVDACACVVDAVISLRAAWQDSSDELGAVTITCGRPECGAVFEITRAMNQAG